jgi:hypothetical protein
MQKEYLELDASELAEVHNISEAAAEYILESRSEMDARKAARAEG